MPPTAATPTTTLHRVEARPLMRAAWRKVPVWNPVEDRWDTFSLRRGRWYTVHYRDADGRGVFAAKAGETRRLVGEKVAAKLARSLRAHGFAVRIVDVAIARYPHLSGDLDAGAAVLTALEKLAVRIDRRVHVLSGGRELAEQQHLWDLYIAGVGNLAAYPNPNAPHVRGVACDAYVIGRDGSWHALRDWLDTWGDRADATACGLEFPVPGESWHVEIIE